MATAPASTAPVINPLTGQPYVVPGMPLQPVTNPQPQQPPGPAQPLSDLIQPGTNPGGVGSTWGQPGIYNPTTGPPGGHTELPPNFFGGQGGGGPQQSVAPTSPTILTTGPNVNAQSASAPQTATTLPPPAVAFGSSVPVQAMRPQDVAEMRQQYPERFYYTEGPGARFERFYTGPIQMRRTQEQAAVPVSSSGATLTGERARPLTWQESQMNKLYELQYSWGKPATAIKYFTGPSVTEQAISGTLTGLTYPFIAPLQIGEAVAFSVAAAQRGISPVTLYGSLGESTVQSVTQRPVAVATSIASGMAYGGISQQPKTQVTGAVTVARIGEPGIGGVSTGYGKSTFITTAGKVKALSTAEYNIETRTFEPPQITDRGQVAQATGEVGIIKTTIIQPRPLGLGEKVTSVETKFGEASVSSPPFGNIEYPSYMIRSAGVTGKTPIIAGTVAEKIYKTETAAGESAMFKQTGAAMIGKENFGVMKGYALVQPASKEAVVSPAGTLATSVGQAAFVAHVRGVGSLEMPVVGSIPTLASLPGLSSLTGGTTRQNVISFQSGRPLQTQMPSVSQAATPMLSSAAMTSTAQRLDTSMAKAPAVRQSIRTAIPTFVFPRISAPRGIIPFQLPKFDDSFFGRIRQRKKSKQPRLYQPTRVAMEFGITSTKVPKTRGGLWSVLKVRPQIGKRFRLPRLV